MEDNCGVLTVAWMQSILSAEQHCSGVGQPVCQGWLKDISYTRVAFTFDRKQFSCLWHYCCILFERSLQFWEPKLKKIATLGHTVQAVGLQLLSAMIYDISAAWHHKVTLSLIRFGGAWEWLLLLLRSSDTSQRLMNKQNNPSFWCQPVIDQSGVFFLHAVMQNAKQPKHNAAELGGLTSSLSVSLGGSYC